MRMFLEQFRENAALFSRRAAITDRDGARETSYEALALLSDQIGVLLQKRGGQRGDFVPVFLPRSMEYAAALIGILKAGCAAIPLYVDYPRERKDFILEQCGCKCMVDEAFLCEALDCQEGLQSVALTQADCAIVIYTAEILLAIPFRIDPCCRW